MSQDAKGGPGAGDYIKRWVLRARTDVENVCPADGEWIGWMGLFYHVLKDRASHRDTPQVMLGELEPFIDPLTRLPCEGQYGFDLLNIASGKIEAVGTIAVSEHGLLIALMARMRDPIPDWLCPRAEWFIPRTADPNAAIETLRAGVRLVGLELLWPEGWNDEETT